MIYTCATESAKSYVKGQKAVTMTTTEYLEEEGFYWKWEGVYLQDSIVYCIELFNLPPLVLKAWHLQCK